MNGSENYTLASLTDERVWRPESLSLKVVGLIAMAASCLFRCGTLQVKVHIHATAREGANRDEIFNSLMIAGLIGRTRGLAPALRGIQEMFPCDRWDSSGLTYDNRVLIHARRTCDIPEDIPRGSVASSQLPHL